MSYKKVRFNLQLFSTQLSRCLWGGERSFNKKINDINKGHGYIKDMNKLLFTITKKDFVVETFKSGGKGGQHQNTTDSGVRIKHSDSGAVGECRDERSQYQNKRKAFKRMASSKKFKAWHRIKCAEYINKKSLDEIVHDLMQPQDLKVEVKDSKGRWIDEQDTLQQ